MSQLVERMRTQRWYHTLELPGHTTDGWFDLRPYVEHYGIPERLDGLRVLDIGTWDGFWAFELERRGAEVVALDVDAESEYDWPPRRRPKEWTVLDRGQGFRLAHEALGSKVERVSCNVYDISPERLGTFDLVFCGSVLIHLRDQLLALERLASVCRGRLILAEAYDRLLSLLPLALSRYKADLDKAVVFWMPSTRCWRRMAWTAGFEQVTEHGRFDMKVRDEFTVPHVVLHARGTAG